MPAIEIYKCSVCKKNRPNKAEAEKCEKLHEEAIPMIESIKQATNMREFIVAYAVLIEKVTGAKPVQVEDVELHYRFSSTEISSMQISLILDKPPVMTNFKEFSRVNLQFTERQGLQIAEIWFHGPNTSYASSFNKYVKAYLKERERLMFDAKADSAKIKAHKAEIQKEINSRLDENVEYVELNQKLEEIKNRVAQEVKADPNFQYVDPSVMLEGLDMDWIKMPVVL